MTVCGAKRERGSSHPTLSRIPYLSPTQECLARVGPWMAQCARIFSIRSRESSR